MTALKKVVLGIVGITIIGVVFRYSMCRTTTSTSVPYSVVLHNTKLTSEASYLCSVGKPKVTEHNGLYSVEIHFANGTEAYYSGFTSVEVRPDESCRPGP